MRRLVSVCLLAAVITAAWSADMAVQALDCAQNARARIVSVLVGAKARTPDVVARVGAQVTKWQLYKVDPLTFGFLDGVRGDNMVTTTGGSNTVTSVDNPWTAADVGKTIYLQGVGTQISLIPPFDYDPLVTTIASFVSAGEITVTDAPARGVTANKTSRGGIAMWGDLVPLTLNASPLTSPDGSIIYQKQALDLTALSSATVTATGGTVAQALSNRFGQELSVKDHGAAGDGSTNDTTAIQATLNAVYAAGGGVAMVPPGTYMVTAPLVVPRGVVLRGKGREVSTIKAKTGWSGSYLVDIGNVANAQPAFGCRCEAITLDCANLVAIGVYSINAQEASGLYDARVRDFTSAGVKMESTNPNVLWFDLCALRDCEIWSGSAATKGVYLKSNGAPSSRVILDNVTILWNSVSAPSGARALEVEKATAYVRQISMEKSDYGVYLSDSGSLHGSGIYLNSGAGTTLLYIDAYSGSVEISDLHHGHSSGVIYNDQVEGVTSTGTHIGGYHRPGYSHVATGNSIKLIKPQIRSGDVTGPGNSAILTASGKEFVRQVAAANGMRISGRYFESRPEDDSNDGDRVTSGLYSPFSGGVDHKWKVSVIPSGGSTWTDMLSISVDGSRTQITGHAWNSNLFMLGTYRLWVDGSGNLRIKGGSDPASDTDGTKVGAQ